jgi:uncharacterized protein YndB with AHSA1/START domain
MADISHLITVAAPPSSLFSLVASGSGFAEWWAEDVTLAADGAVELGFFDRGTIYRLRPQTHLAPQRAEWVCESGTEWAGTRLTFELTPSGAGTALRFGHLGWRAATDYFISCNTTWGGLLFRLRAAAEGRAPGPLFLRSTLAY